MAFAANPVLSAAQARVSETQATFKLLKADSLPQLTLDGGPGFISGQAIGPFGVLGGREAATGQPSVGITGGLYDFTLSLNMPLFVEGRLVGQQTHSQREAALAIQEAAMNLADLRRQVGSTVATAWYQEAVNEHSIPLRERLVRLREDILRLAVAREEQRLISRSDELVFEVSLATARHDLDAARITMERARIALGAAMGRLGKAVQPSEEGGPVPTAVSAEVAMALVAVSPAIRAAELRVEEKREFEVRASKNRLPTLQFQAHYGIADAYSLPVPNSQYYAGIRVFFPVFDSGDGRQKVALAIAQRQEEEANLRTERLSRAAVIEDLRAQSRQLEIDADLIRAQVEQASEALKTNTAKAAEGLMSPADQAQTEAALVGLQISLNSTIYAQRLADTQLRLAIGEWDVAAPPASH